GAFPEMGRGKGVEGHRSERARPPGVEEARDAYADDRPDDPEWDGSPDLAGCRHEPFAARPRDAALPSPRSLIPRRPRSAEGDEDASALISGPALPLSGK